MDDRNSGVPLAHGLVMEFPCEAALPCVPEPPAELDGELALCEVLADRAAPPMGLASKLTSITSSTEVSWYLGGSCQFGVHCSAVTDAFDELARVEGLCPDCERGLPEPSIGSCDLGAMVLRLAFGDVGGGEVGFREVEFGVVEFGVVDPVLVRFPIPGPYCRIATIKLAWPTDSAWLSS